jgi:hypothetical protein
MPDEPGWYPDPKGEANYRFYDGRKWTKSVAADRPDAEGTSDGPVVGGLMGLLDHRPERVPMAAEEDPEPLWGREQPLLDPNVDVSPPRQSAPAPPPPPPESAPAPPPPPPPPSSASAPPPPPPPPPRD